MIPILTSVNHRTSWLKNLLLWVVGLFLVINYFVIRAYGDVIRSSHLFVASPAVFYPLSFVNLLLGILLIFALVRESWASRRKR